MDTHTSILNVKTHLKRYNQRPNQFEQYTLMEFSQKVSGRGSHYHCARKDNVVRVIPNYLESDPIDPNSNYYRIPCLLQISFRGEPDHLLHNTIAGHCTSWKQLYDYYKFGDTNDDQLDVDLLNLDEDIEVEALDNEIRKSVFEIASSFHPNVDNSELGERIIDGFDWNHISENFPSLDDAKTFLKTYKDTYQSMEIDDCTHQIIFNTEQQQVIDLLEHQIDSLLNK